jgi:DNA-directed RNA polymerase subunit RPC12/RpoP
VNDYDYLYVERETTRRNLNRRHEKEMIKGYFICVNCHQMVCFHPTTSGVNNRNHCPYCLWSRHMDHYEAGDRLSACKEGMQPIGLTRKDSRSKYNAANGGELMLVHQCIECGKVSINRIAADDLSEELLQVYENGCSMNNGNHFRLLQAGVTILTDKDREVVNIHLYGITQ